MTEEKAKMSGKKKLAIAGGVVAAGMMTGGVFAVQAISDLTDRMDQAPVARMEMPEPTPTATEMPDVRPTDSVPAEPVIMTETITIPARTSTTTVTETETITETSTITETITPTSEKKVVEQEADDGNKDEGKDEGETSGTNAPPVIDEPADGEG